MLGAATRNWTAVWQGFGNLTMSVDSVEASDDRETLFVHTVFINESDQPLQVHVLETGLRLSGRSITAGSERYDDVRLEPGERIELTTTQRVRGLERGVVDERLSSGSGTWNISGRVQVSVADLSDPLWLPFRYDVDVGLTQ
jgi:hypothetical protein